MPFLDPGPYTITNANGGGDIGPFNAQITLPAAIEWSNYDDIQTVSRNQPLTIRWTGGNPSTDYVTVVGMASRNTPSVGTTFACTASAGDGQLVVPAEVLSAMPATETNAGVPTGSLTSTTLRYVTLAGSRRRGCRSVRCGINWRQSRMWRFSKGDRSRRDEHSRNCMLLRL